MSKRPMDKRTSDRMGRLASRVLRDGKVTPTEAKRLAGCVMAQVSERKAHLAKKAKKRA